jgi:hypothetical protein
LLWRTRQNARLDVEKRLPDGSYLSRIYGSTKDRRKKRNGIVIRVIDYRLKNAPDAEPLYRLLTTIRDPQQAPAKELAPCITSGLLRHRAGAVYAVLLS